MRKALKYIAIISALSITLSIFYACSSKKDGDTTSTTQTTALTTHLDPTANISTTAPTTTTTTIYTTTTAKIEIETADFQTVLNLIKNYPQGTAGSMAKCVDISLEFINFCQMNTKSIDSLQEIYDKFIDGMSDSEKEQFKSNLYDVNYVSRKLIEGEDTVFQSHLAQTKKIYLRGKYTMSKYDAVYEITVDK